MNLIDWCNLAREEDNENVLYANFLYEIDNKHIDGIILDDFDNELPKLPNPSSVNKANAYVKAASDNAGLALRGQTFQVPDEGVARVITAKTFHEEYNSFLIGIGITANPEELYNVLIHKDEVKNLIYASESERKLEEWAKLHTKTLEELYSDSPTDMPASVSTFGEVQDERVTWVTKISELENELNNNSANPSDAARKILGLNYAKSLKNEPIKLIFVKYESRDKNDMLHKPTIFSLGFVDAYCAVPYGGTNWGCTAELETGEPGLPEAVTSRKTFDRMVYSDFIGTCDCDTSPHAPNIQRISKRLGHTIGFRYDCSKASCDRLSSRRNP